MKCWHYNVIRIIRSKQFSEALLACLDILEPTKDNSIILAMLKSYFNSRNRDFGSNWIDLPSCRTTLKINQQGIYFEGTGGYDDLGIFDLSNLNNALQASIGTRDWVVTFRLPFTAGEQDG